MTTRQVGASPPATKKITRIIYIVKMKTIKRVKRHPKKGYNIYEYEDGTIEKALIEKTEEVTNFEGDKLTRYHYTDGTFDSFLNGKRIIYNKV